MRITDLIKNSELFHLFAAKSRFLHFFSPGLSADHQLFNPEKYHIYITLLSHYFPSMFLPPVSGLLPRVTASKDVAVHVSTCTNLFMSPLQDGNSNFPKKEILIPHAGSDNQSIRPFQIPHYLLLKPLRYSRDSAGPCAGAFLISCTSQHKCL